MDSTFRVIQLLMSTECILQPHYIVDGEESTGIEIDTMNKIRSRITRESPGVQSRFLPTIYFNSRAIKADEEIRLYIEELRVTQKVDVQYQLMANYCKQFGISQIEVGLTRLSAQKEDFVFFRDSPAFKYFLYPTLNFSKPDMYKIASENGWDSWLNMTSFCRRPKVTLMPCGKCPPCIESEREEGDSELRPVSRIKAFVQIPFRNYRRMRYKD